MTKPTSAEADALVADARRAVHDSLVLLPKHEADRVHALIANLEAAVVSRTVMRMEVRWGAGPGEPGVTMHAVPLPGSNGISACCGRPPHEFVGERVTGDPTKVTCPGPAAGAPPDGVPS